MSLRVLTLLVVVVSATVAAAITVDDGLFDLRLVPLEGQTPAAFTLPGLDGNLVSLAQFKGDVVFLYFWATW
jgi:hypothetical protein